MPHFSEEEKIIICCHDLAAELGGLTEMLRSIEAGVQLRASTGHGVDDATALELIALALRTADQIEKRRAAFKELREQLFADDHDD